MMGFPLAGFQFPARQVQIEARDWSVPCRRQPPLARSEVPTHHLGGVPFDWNALSRSVLYQAALSITWAVVGLTSMIVGMRRQQRLVWYGGAGLMGIVVLKLFLIDLGNSGTVERIISFIGVGLLLLVVGYLAPVPGHKKLPAGPRSAAREP